MVDDLPDGPFDAVLVAYNTIFNLLDDGDQQRCFPRSLGASGRAASSWSRRSSPISRRMRRTPSTVDVRSLAVDHVVLSVSAIDHGDQRAEGQFVEFTEAGGVRLRPWSIRWATPSQLDAMARLQGWDSPIAGRT